MARPSFPVGAVFGRTFPPATIGEFAERLEAMGADELWVIEDCFFTSAPSLAATALARTETLRVGIGIVPAVARNAAVTAMEFATLAGLAPGRLIGGIGHGVQEWMAQMGVRPESPLTALREHLDAVRRLLAGETVSATGRYVTLEDVALEHPPSPAPPVLAGVRGPKSMALAGRFADGVLLAEPAAATYVTAAREQADAGPDFPVHVFATFALAHDAVAARRMWTPLLGSWIEEGTANVTALPFFDEMHDLWRVGGEAALETMPREWWVALMPVGTAADAHAHLEQLAAARVAGAAMILSPDVAMARRQLDDLEKLLR